MDGRHPIEQKSLQCWRGSSKCLGCVRFHTIQAFISQVLYRRITGSAGVVGVRLVSLPDCCIWRFRTKSCCFSGFKLKRKQPSPFFVSATGSAQNISSVAVAHCTVDGICNRDRFGSGICRIRFDSTCPGRLFDKSIIGLEKRHHLGLQTFSLATSSARCRRHCSSQSSSFQFNGYYDVVSSVICQIDSFAASYHRVIHVDCIW